MEREEREDEERQDETVQKEEDDEEEQNEQEEPKEKGERETTSTSHYHKYRIILKWEFFLWEGMVSHVCTVQNFANGNKVIVIVQKCNC